MSKFLGRQQTDKIPTLHTVASPRHTAFNFYFLHLISHFSHHFTNLLFPTPDHSHTILIPHPIHLPTLPSSSVPFIVLSRADRQNGSIVSKDAPLVLRHLLKDLFSSVLGFPRMGVNRDLKKATESYWAGKISQKELLAEGKRLRGEHWKIQKEAGINIIPSNDFSYYDHVLDHIQLFGVSRHRQCAACARDPDTD